jgi:hypothetical protein
MIGRRTAVGLSLLCALAFSALATQSASAAKAVNTTAFTCVKGGGFKDFKDPHCNTFAGVEKGEYGHISIKAGETTKIEATNTEIVGFSSSLGGVKVGGFCNKATTEGNLHNIESESKKHTVTGELSTKISECTVTKPAKCIVKEPLVVETTFEGVEGLGPEKNQMGAELKAKNGEGAFVTIEFKNKGAEACALNGKSFVVQSIGGAGSGTVGTGSPPPTEKFTGEANFTGAMSEESLEAGGSAVNFSVKATMRMAGGENPISLTTVT